MRPQLACALLTLAASCRAPAPPPADAPLTLTVVRTLPPGQRLGALTFRGGLELFDDGASPREGGLSALHAAADGRVCWLVSDLGDWFRAGGYRTHYRGKWHISHADLVAAGSHRGLPTNDDDGVIDQRAKGHALLKPIAFY